MVYKSVYRSLRIKLDDFINSKDEQLIMENLRRCRYIAGKQFSLILWNENLKEKEVKNFFKRYSDLLFILNTKITKKFNITWFIINTNDINGDESKYRYKWNGSILEGLVHYNKMMNHLNSKGD
tara:strand:+ start:318 stop:689 length:372 start_codon:yes stop_codon:yes gene_type:complete